MTCTGMTCTGMKRSVLLLLLLVSSMSAKGGRAIGAVLCTGQVTINSTVRDLDGIVSWPVAEGDEVATRTSRGAVVLLDGGRVVLERNSRVKLGPLRLVSGTMYFALVAGEQPRAGSATVRDGEVVITPGGKAPPVEFDSWKLMRRLPYVLGEYLRRNR